MKKFLLLSSAIVASLSTLATPQIYSNLEVRALSANGQYMVSEIYESVQLINLETGARTEYTVDLDKGLSFSLGMGNCVADDGTFTGNISYTSPAYIFKDGKYIMLPTSNSALSGIANGITPDGKVICGTQRTGTSEMDDKIYSLPCIWEKGEDGEYGLPVMLPHPTKDFTDRAPQLINAIYISADGNTIAGMLHDNAGFMNQPIIYTRNSEGEWSYKLVHPELLNPNSVEFPPYPGDGPQMPDIKNYMTDSELQQFNLAYQEWEEYCETTGSWNYDTMPVEEDFMSQDSKDAYDDAMVVWRKANDAWSVEFVAFTNAYDECMSSGCNFVYNNIFLTSDGKKMALTDQRTEGSVESGSQVSYCTPYIFNLEADTYSHNPQEKNSMVSAMADDGTLFVYNSNYYFINTQVRTPAGDIISLQDFMDGKSQGVAQWMKENMYHDMDVYDYSSMTWKPEENVPVFGLAYCTPDLGTVATCASNEWYEDQTAECYTYILDIAKTNGIGTLTVDSSIKVTVRKGGVIEVEGEASAIEIYDMQGRKAYRMQNPGSYVATSLSEGMYIISITTPAGESKSFKAIF